MSSSSPTDATVPIATPASRPWWRTFLVRAAFLCAVLGTLVVAFYLLEWIRGQSAWKRYQDEARARGVKLTLAEYLPPPVPDERNFAAVPIFQDTFRKPRPPYPLQMPKADGVTQPPLDSAVKGQLIDLTAWQKFFVETKLLPSAGENAASDVLQALETYAPQFEQLRLAGTRPECRFPVRYEDGPETELPHFAVFQFAARLYALRLAAHLALGDSAAACDDFQDGLRLYMALEREPTLIAGLVRVFMIETFESAVWAGLVRRQWGAPELEKITADLAGVRLMDDYTLGLGSERGFSNMLHDQFVQKGTGELARLLGLVEAGQSGSVPNAPSAGALLALYPGGWLRLSQTRANRYFDEMLARVAQEPPRVFPERDVPSMPREIGNVGTIERVRYLLFFTLAPAFAEVERRYAYSQTLLDQTRLGCALERYRLAHGVFPASLEALTPAFLPELPRDLMNGEPLHYRLTEGGGYTLYSVAWNLTDDGGKSDPKTKTAEQLDWVWSVPGK